MMRTVECIALLYERDFLVRGDQGFRVYIDTTETNHIPFHNHDHHEITIILDGGCTMYTESHEYELSAGDVIICTPDMAHGYDNFNNMRHCVIGFHKDRYMHESPELLNIPGYESLFTIEPSLRNKKDVLHNLKLAPNKLAQTEKLLQKMVVEFNRKSSGFTVLLQSYLQELIVFLCREYSFSQARNSGMAEIQPLANVVEFIQHNYNKKISLNDLTKIYGFSKEYLIRQFKAVYKMTPLEYITHIRLQHATHELVNTNRSITEVSYSNGFNDSNYFSRCFKKSLGVTPAAYRKYRKIN